MSIILFILFGVIISIVNIFYSKVDLLKQGSKWIHLLFIRTAHRIASAND